jgi:dTDP-4-amino-4,6-dideoxygalactose transaminase
MIKFHEVYKAKNTKKYLNKVIHRNSYNDNFFINACLERLEEIYKTDKLLLTHSCTASLEISAMMLKELSSNNVENQNIKIPSYTFSSTANAFLRSGFHVKFLDISLDDLIVENSNLDNLSTLVAVNYANSTFDYKEKYNKSLIEDAAQSFGTTYKGQPVGTFGRFGCISFHPTKNINSGYGGLFIQNDNSDDFDLARSIWERGTDRNKVISGLKRKYEWVSLGSSFQITELSAAVLLSQLESSEKIIKLRSEIYKSYVEYLKPLIENQTIRIQKINRNIDPNYHAFYIIIKENRDRFLDYLYNSGIQAYIGYESLHESSYANKLNLNHNLINTQNIAPYVVRLPLHTGLKVKDVMYICNKIKEYNSN